MEQPIQPFTGTHIVSNLIGCDFKTYLHSAASIREAVEKVCREQGMQVLGGYYHDFNDEGAVTGVCVLGESHVALHTWPELGYVTLDVFLCDYTRDNSQATRRIADAIAGLFHPESVSTQEIRR